MRVTISLHIPEGTKPRTWLAACIAEGGQPMSNRPTKEDIARQKAGLLGLGAVMDTHDDRLGQNASLAERVARLERIEERNSALLFEASLGCLKEITLSDPNAPEEGYDLPTITDKKSFSEYVAAVTAKLNSKAITGADARALLYAAQLSLTALKGAN